MLGRPIRGGGQIISKSCIFHQKLSLHLLLGWGVRSHPASWTNYFKIMQFFTRNTPNFGLKIRIFLRFASPPPPLKSMGLPGMTHQDQTLSATYQNLRSDTRSTELSLSIAYSDHFRTPLQNTDYHKKILKIWTPEKFAVIILKVEQFGFVTE